MKEELLKIIYELWKKFKYSGDDVHFNVNGKKYYTDTGYAMDGIDAYVEQLQKIVNNSSLFNN